MSVKMKVKNVKAVRTGKSRKARVSNEQLGNFLGDQSNSCNNRNNECCRPRDGAVEGIQEAGADLGELFNKLRHREVAERLVRAIRCRNRKIIEELIGPNCHVVCFFCQGRYSCVRIECVFGPCCDVRISFDICVSQGNCHNGY